MTANEAWDRVSVCIVTLNEESNLERCIESVSPCGELIVVDSGSTDQTREIAERFGVKWFVRDWDGFAKQREFAEQQATREFVLFLDADEWLSAELRTEIAELLALESSGRQIFALRRHSEFLDRPIRFGDWKNDWVTRLIPRNRARWSGVEPHPYLVSKELSLHRCRYPLYHRPYRDEATFRAKLDSYARTWAKDAFQNGMRGGTLTGLSRGTWRFIRSYILRGGFCDGHPGFLIARGNAAMVRRKYFYLSELRASRNLHRSADI